MKYIFYSVEPLTTSWCEHSSPAFPNLRAVGSSEIFDLHMFTSLTPRKSQTFEMGREEHEKAERFRVPGGAARPGEEDTHSET